MAIRNATPGGSTTSGPPPAVPSTTMSTTISTTALTIPVKLPNGQIVTVGSQAEVEALRAAVQPTQVVDLSKSASSSGASSTANIIDIAADGFQAVGGFLAGSKYSRLLQDFRDARDDLVTAREALARESGSSPALLAAMDAQLNYMDAAIELLNAQITAVDIMAGGSTAKVISKLMDGSGGFGSGMGTALAVGAGGVGLGLLLSSNNNNNDSRSRRR